MQTISNLIMFCVKFDYIILVFLLLYILLFVQFSVFLLLVFFLFNIFCACHGQTSSCSININITKKYYFYLLVDHFNCVKSFHYR